MKYFLAIVPLLLYAEISQAAPMVNRFSEEKAPNSPAHAPTEAAVPSVGSLPTPPPSPPTNHTPQPQQPPSQPRPSQPHHHPPQTATQPLPPQRQPHQYDDQPPPPPRRQPNQYHYPPPSQPQHPSSQQNVQPSQPQPRPSSQHNSQPPQPQHHPSSRYISQPPQPHPYPPEYYRQPSNPYVQHDPSQQHPPCPPECQPPPEQPPKQTGWAYGICNLIKVVRRTVYETLVGEDGILTNLVYTPPKKSKHSRGGGEVPSGCCVFVRNTPSDPDNDGENGPKSIALPPITCYMIRNRSSTTTPGTTVGASLVPGAETNTKSDQVNCCCVGKHIFNFKKLFKWIFKPQVNICACPINITGAE